MCEYITLNPVRALKQTVSFPSLVVQLLQAAQSMFLEDITLFSHEANGYAIVCYLKGDNFCTFLFAAQGNTTAPKVIYP